MKYLTTSQLRLYSGGIDVTNLPDLNLELIITLCEAAVDTYCQTELQYKSWHQVSQFKGLGKRIYLNSVPAPVLIIDAAVVQIGMIQSSGNPQTLVLDPKTIEVNDTNDYITLTSLAPLVQASANVNVWYNDYQDDMVILDYHTGFFLPQHGELLFANNVGNQYQSRRSFWASSITESPNVLLNDVPPIPPVIYLNGTVQDPSTYTLDYLNGIVEFTTAIAPSSKVTADYTFTIPDAVREATRLTVFPLLAEQELHQSGVVGVRSLEAAGIRVEGLGEVRIPAMAKVLLQNFVSRGI